MIDKYVAKLRSGASVDAVAREIVADERMAVERAEMAVEARDRERVERTVAYGASELGVAAPKVRFFNGATFDFGGIHFKSWPNEIWVDGRRALHDMKRLALHETQHVQHYADATGADLDYDDRHAFLERDAERFSERGRHW